MLREIDERASDNLRVTLYWDDVKDTMTVEVEDRVNPNLDCTLTDIPKADAQQAFTHPFTYRRAAA